MYKNEPRSATHEAENEVPKIQQNPFPIYTVGEAELILRGRFPELCKIVDERTYFSCETAPKVWGETGVWGQSLCAGVVYKPENPLISLRFPPASLFTLTASSRAGVYVHKK